MDTEQPPEQLSGAQKAYLRGLAMNRKPDLHIGKKGLWAGALAQFEGALKKGELVKLKLAGTREERVGLSAAIVAQTGCTIVGQVGRTALFYRRHTDPDKRVVSLPG